MTLAVKKIPEGMGTHQGLNPACNAHAKREEPAAIHYEKGARTDAKPDIEARLSFTDKAVLVPRKIGLFLSRTRIALSGREADADECDALGFGYLLVGDSQRAAEYFTRSDEMRALFPRERGQHAGATVTFVPGEEKKR